MRACMCVCVENSDEKPQKICENCFNFLNKLNEFHEKCINSENYFNEILTKKNECIEIDPIDIQSVKIEFDDCIEKNIKKEYNQSDGNSLENNICKENLVFYSEEDKTNTTTKTKKNSETNKLFKCEICEKVFYKHNTFNHHFRYAHSAIRFYCSMCPKSFGTGEILKSHEDTHLPDSIRKIHFCEFCNKKFVRLNNVVAHVKTVHSDEISFICDECGKGFRSKGALNSHQFTHLKELPFPCPDCPKRFSSNSTLKVHRDIHSGTTYNCNVCQSTFKTNKSLQNHMIAHSDERKYECNFCTNKYKRAKDLKTHLISHTGIRPYKCPFCDKTFLDGSNCRVHQKRMHPIEFTNAEKIKVRRIKNIPRLEQLQRQFAKISKTGNGKIEIDF